MSKKKLIIAKVCKGEKQKRLTIPKQKETEDWEQGDLIKMGKIE